MKVITDKKSNLARGFADLNTPTEVEKELLFTWQERKQYLNDQILSLTEQALNERNLKKKNALNYQLLDSRKSLHALGSKITKRVDLSLLIIDRIKQQMSADQFETLCKLARRDKERILGQIYLTGK